MPSPADQTAESLLHDSRWIGRLALSLVGDAATAQDLVQETWLVALGANGRAGSLGVRRSRAWLAGVLRNLARRRFRGERRRERRERRGFEPDQEPRRAPSAETLVLRAEAQQRVARAVLELAEPWRSTLLLRFFEDLSPAEIAAQQAVPEDTVRARIRRGAQELRGRLGGLEDEAWSDWCAILLPLPGVGRPALAASGGLAPGSAALAWPLIGKWTLAAGLLLLGVGWYALVEQQPAAGAAALEAPVVQALGASEGTQLELASRGPAPGAERRQAVQRSPLPASIGGTVVFVLPDGERVRGASGELQFFDPSEGLSSLERVPIRAGRWEHVPAVGASGPPQLRAISMEDDGQRRRALALPQWSTLESTLERQHWTLRVEALACVHVVDVELGAELGPVEVLADSQDFVGTPHLDDAHRRSQRLASGPSPLWIPMGDAGADSLSVWVGGEMLQWQQIELITDLDSERWIRPSAAGELLVRFQGGPALLGCELRLETPGGALFGDGGGWYTRLGAVDQARLTGLPAGRYRATLSFQPPFAEHPLAVELGHCSALVRAGERSEVVLQRAPLAETATLELRARVEIPPAWKLESFHLRVHPLRAGTASEEHAWTEQSLPLDAEGRASFFLHDLQAGIYLLDFFSVGVVHRRMLLDLQPPLERIRLVLPPPISGRVRAVDSAGAPLELSWLYRLGEEHEGVAGRATSFDCGDPQPGGWIPIRVPEGPGELRVITADGRRATLALGAQSEGFELVIPVP